MQNTNWRVRKHLMVSKLNLLPNYCFTTSHNHITHFSYVQFSQHPSGSCQSAAKLAVWMTVSSWPCTLHRGKWCKRGTGPFLLHLEASFSGCCSSREKSSVTCQTAWWEGTIPRMDTLVISKINCHCQTSKSKPPPKIPTPKFQNIYYD